MINREDVVLGTDIEYHDKYHGLQRGKIVDVYPDSVVVGVRWEGRGSSVQYQSMEFVLETCSLHRDPIDVLIQAVDG